MNIKEYKANQNMYQCSECGTKYYTPEDNPPPSPRWADGHKCTMVLKQKKK